MLTEQFLLSSGGKSLGIINFLDLPCGLHVVKVVLETGIKRQCQKEIKRRVASK
jgi:hypothetical protein